MEYCNNDAVNSLEALGFKMLSAEIKMEIEAQFFFSFKTVTSLQCNSSYSVDKLNFHLKKADRSKCLRRRRDFNS